MAYYGFHKDIKDYPAVFDHLKKYEVQLKKRGQVRYTSSGKPKIGADFPGQHHWLELDNNPRREYMDDFSQQKIIYPETTQSARFYYDLEEYMVEKTCFIMTGKYLRYISSTLSSTIFEFAYKRLFSSIALGENGYQYNKHALEKLPIATTNIDKTLSEIEIKEIYQLTDEEMNFISSSVKL